MQFGIVGMPLVGKTTLFNALTHAHAETGAYRAATRDPNRAVVKVEDPRLAHLAEVFRPKKVTPAAIEYVDMAGLPRGSIEKGGMSPQFVAALRTVDALVHVVRAFEDVNLPHVFDSLNPRRDAQALDSEFAIADLQIVENRLERLSKELRTVKSPQLLHEQATLKRCQETLEAGRPLRELDLEAEEQRLLKGFRFLTQKPLLLLLNIGEADLGNPDVLELLEWWRKRPRTDVLALCAKMEMELAELPEEEAKAFRAELGLDEPALTKMVGVSYRLLGMLTFFTGGDVELHAWTIPAGSTALDAAAMVHTDMARGFIRAERVYWEDLVRHGSSTKAREEGLLHVEGKDYLVQDGDVLLIRFNV